MRNDLLGLGVEVADADELAVLVDRRLTRDEQQVADPEALREPEGLVRIGIELDRGKVGHVEIIFFSTPTPAAYGPLDLERHGRGVLQRDPRRVEDRDLVVRLPALELAADHLADLAGDVVLGDQPLAERRR